MAFITDFQHHFGRKKSMNKSELTFQRQIKEQTKNKTQILYCRNSNSSILSRSPSTSRPKHFQFLTRHRRLSFFKLFNNCYTSPKIQTEHIFIKQTS